MVPAPTAAPATVAAAYFDGRSSARHAVVLAVADGHVSVRGEGIDRRDPLVTVRLSERMGAAPRLVTFADGGFCEVRDHATFERLLEASGHRESVVVRMQSSWRWAVAAVGACVAAVVWAYFMGVPLLADIVAKRAPPAVTTRLSEMSLEFFDRRILKPSKLPAERRAELADKFARLVPPDGAPVAHQVLFREGRGVGANAFALPSGTIVVTDELVRIADDDNEILAVLTHELGHVHERHGLRLVLESSIVGLAVTWYLGDFSSLAAGVPAALMRARYSRDHERDADAYAARMLLANGLSPMLLATMLEKLEHSHRPPAPADRAASADGDAGHEGRHDDEVLDYLSSHPATEERIAALRAIADQHAAGR